MLAGMLGSIISGLNYNSQRVGVAADNISNVSTTGYKAASVKSSTLVTGQTSINAYSAGGVQTVSHQLVDVQGIIGASTSKTDLAVSGSGFFAIKSSPSSSEILYTRDGSFKPNNEGFLVNSSGYYLQANNPSTGNLEALNVNGTVGAATATTDAKISVNLPAGANVGDAQTINLQAFDTLGGELSVPVTFEKKSTSVFTLSVGDIIDNNSGATISTPTEGNVSGPAYSVDVFFSSDGSIGGYDTDSDGVIDSTSPPGIYLSFSTRPSGDISINADLTGTTSFAGDFTINSIEANGAAYGSYNSVDISSDGTVSASFNNGQSRAIGKIPVATFTNENGLEALSGNAYRETTASGSVNLQNAGSAGAGTVQGGALEFSTTDIGSEFVNLILSRNAYSASLKALSTAEEMSTALIRQVA
ncbi:MAG: flagellar hook-basal body complex protein [Rhodospirillaceae bacterium]|nr:flagellar hook-basal body complex protein [Rhodospirillaceae bacterium]